MTETVSTTRLHAVLIILKDPCRRGVWISESAAMLVYVSADTLEYVFVSANAAMIIPRITLFQIAFQFRFAQAY